MYLTPFTLTQNIALDNALSTIQVIHQLISKINDVITELNNINVTANDYTDEQIRKLTEKIDSDLTELENTLKAYSDAGVSNLKEYVDTDVANLRADLNTAVTNLKADIKLLERDLKLYSDVGDSLLKVYINTLYDELLEIITNGKNLIYSPVDGGFKSVKDAIFDMANVVQQKNGVNWKTLETLCNNEEYNLTGFNKVNNNYNIYYKGGEHTKITYLGSEGISIHSDVSIKTFIVDGENSTNFRGGTASAELNTLQKFETTMVITDINDTITHYTFINMDYFVPSKVTYDSWHDKLIAISKFNNWYSFAFYTCYFLQESLTRTNGNPVDIKNQIEYMSLLNEDFYDKKGV